jgi:hypothetical protein
MSFEHSIFIINQQTGIAASRKKWFMAIVEKLGNNLLHTAKGFLHYEKIYKPWKSRKVYPESIFNGARDIFLKYSPYDK